MLYLLDFHSLVLGKVAVFLVAVVKVDTTRDAFVILGTFLKDFDGKVTSTRVAFVILAIPLEGGSLSSFTRRGRDLREQSLPRHICSVGLLVVE